MRVTKTKRNLEIIQLREKNIPMTKIGKIFGISRERVRQILIRGGYVHD